jgi:hypothetical protein
MAPTDNLSDEECEVLRALQQGGTTPLPQEPIWDYLVAADLVWIDRDVHPHEVRLTPRGRAYPAPA